MSTQTFNKLCHMKKCKLETDVDEWDSSTNKKMGRNLSSEEYGRVMEEDEDIKIMSTEG